jgi:short-subunit dehydrogenase involved in D-alanine esterification of teichoic acids
MATLIKRTNRVYYEVVNFHGTILPTMVFTKDMIEKGSGVVLNISSMNSFLPLTKIPAYSATKASINNFFGIGTVGVQRTIYGREGLTSNENRCR